MKAIIATTLGIVLATTSALASPLSTPHKKIETPVSTAPATDQSNTASNLGLTITDPEAAGLKYVFGKNQNLDGWHFVYGPLHAKSKSVQYSVQGKNGSLTFSCDSSGRQEMVLLLAGETSPTGTKKVFSFGIGNLNKAVELLSSKQQPHQIESIFYGTGGVMMSLLENISALDDTMPSNTAVVVGVDGRYLELPNPEPKDEAIETQRLCRTWYAQHMEDILKSDAPQTIRKPLNHEKPSSLATPPGQ